MQEKLGVNEVLLQHFFDIKQRVFIAVFFIFCCAFFATSINIAIYNDIVKLYFNV